jgi:hypothetical protein
MAPLTISGSHCTCRFVLSLVKPSANSEKLIIGKLMNKFLAFHGTGRSIITVCTVLVPDNVRVSVSMSVACIHLAGVPAYQWLLGKGRDVAVYSTTFCSSRQISMT